MKPASFRLVIAALAFAGWIGWLAYLAFTAGTRPGPGVRKPPIILSHSQFLESNLDVVGEVEEVNGQPDPNVTILEVLWPEAQKLREHSTITVSDLGASKNWAGAGQYILPLVTRDNKTSQVASIPRSPGFDVQHQRLIYPYNSETRAQYEEIKKPAAPEPAKQALKKP
jgi:hypothetical protein